jgi:hypothetical protein
MAASELTQQLDLVRKVAHRHLASFARSDADFCKESYLFKDERFCGIKIVLGHFQARWEVGQVNVEFRRGNQHLQTVALNAESLDGSQRRAA